MNVPLTLYGLPIVTDVNLVDVVEDWSQVRSKGRAARRRSQGHRQRIKLIANPKTEVFLIGGRYFMHPRMLRELELDMQRMGSLL